MGLLSPEQQQELNDHQKLLTGKGEGESSASKNKEPYKKVPIISGDVLTSLPSTTFSQYGLLGEHFKATDDSRALLHISPPWSTFICGSQGSGKSHTLSCILENCLRNSEASKLQRPLAGMVFHWDRFTSYGSNQVCEAAYLCSIGIPVKILVSPSNLSNMKAAYGNLPHLGDGSVKPEVVPLLLNEKQLDVAKLMTMMGFGTKLHDIPLYMQSILRILRGMAREQQKDKDEKAKKNKDKKDNVNSGKGLGYRMLIDLINEEQFDIGQLNPLILRLDLVGSFLRSSSEVGEADRPLIIKEFRNGKLCKNRKLKPIEKLSKEGEAAVQATWDFEPGGLTIVDLSCPFVDENAACALFTICLQLFLEKREEVGRVVALDEAHKFLTESPGAVAFTEELLQVIRQQRHLASRVVIATQEPTLSPKLLELCSVTIVHHFTSPSWFETLQGHVAGLSEKFAVGEEGGNEDELARKKAITRLFKEIVNLETGEGLLFCPTALIDCDSGTDSTSVQPHKLGTGYLRMRTRKRLTADGGISIMAE